MICWRSRAFLRSRRPPDGSFLEAEWPRVLAASPSRSLSFAGSVEDGCLTEIFARGMMLFLLQSAPRWVREQYCVSGPNIIVTNAKLQALCGVLLLRRAEIRADGSWNVRAYRLADSRSSERDTREEWRARLLDFHEGKKYWRRGWELNPLRLLIGRKLLILRSAR